MKNNYKLLILLFLILVTLISFLFNNLTKNDSLHNTFKLDSSLIESFKVNDSENSTNYHDVWCIFTKADERRNQVRKFSNMLVSMLGFASVPITLHLITDDTSKSIAKNTIDKALNFTGRDIQVQYYDVAEATSLMEDIVSVMKPHFSPKSGSYYSDSLFYISLGLHRIAPRDINRAILIDIDLQFEDDIALLFNEFNSFSESNLYGLGPELAPVYYHLLSTYRSRNIHRPLTIGTPCCTHLPISMLLRKNHRSIITSSSNPNEFNISADSIVPGRPGLNSGVVLLKLDKIRSSLLYQTVTTEDFVMSLTEKYLFKGHLGDQDFYSLLSWEVPSIIHTLDCGWNRQLCTWWRDHGYPKIHEAFSYCPNRTRIYHANCNSQFPDISFKND